MPIHEAARKTGFATETDSARAKAPSKTPATGSPGAPPGTIGVEQVLLLQRLVGNSGTCRLLAEAPSVRRPDRLGAATMAHQEPVHIQRKDTPRSPATIVNAGINVRDARGGSDQLGHAMDVWVDIDAGKEPVTPPNARPNTVYGLELEYWEYIDVTADNQGPVAKKSWTDIYGMKPDASTFKTAADGCDVTWDDAVTQAKEKTLIGKKRIGFRDIPGLWEHVKNAPPDPKRNADRTLKFRIVFSDGNQKREIFATQVLRINNGKLGYSAYMDSVGNGLESHGFGSDSYVPASLAEKQKIADEPRRLDRGALPSNREIEAALPLEAKSGVQSFVAALLQGTAKPFVDLEMAEFLKKVDAARQQAGAGEWLSIFSRAFMGDVTGGVSAGQFLVPQMPGTRRFQTVLRSGGLLVALATANNVLKVYYTDGRTTNISMNCIDALKAKNWTINLRSFAEIPTEMIQNSVTTFRDRRLPPATTKDIAVKDDSTQLRDYVQRGANYIVTPDKKLVRVKVGKNVSLFQPEVRDVTGEWLMASYGKTTGFVRASKLTAIGAKQAWEDSQRGALPENSGNDSMAAYFDKYFSDNGNGHAVYSNLLADYPGFGALIDETYKKKYGEPAFAQMNWDRFYGLPATVFDGRRTQVIAAMMTVVKGSPGRGDQLEAAYNKHVPSLRKDVPATLGELVNEFFIMVFTSKGNGFAIYNGLLREYPDFSYRLKPAYRQVFGEAELQAMLKDRQDAESAQEVPDPESVDNTIGYLQFQLHNPFVATDFRPSTGGGKFDARYTPSDGKLVITIKVCYKFADTDWDPVDIAKENPALDPSFGQQKWSEQAKADWKSSYKKAATDAFNNSGHKITCTRPGWTDIVAKPSFEIVEVPAGQQHYIIDATKNVLRQDADKKKLQGIRAGAGFASLEGINVPSVILNEFDVYDKFKDPRLHGYLHANEASQNVEPAYLLDRRRLEDTLSRLGRVQFVGEQQLVRDSIRNLADALKRLKIPSTLATLHPIEVKGVTTVPGDLSTRRADFVRRQLTGAGVANPTVVTSEVGDFDGVVVGVRPEDPAIKATYITNWSRFTAAHEFGHMIGLIDEYYGATSDEVVKQMISAGLLPAGTPGNHLVANPPPNDQLKEKDKQEATLKLLKRADVESPDFALNAPGSSMPKTTSLMSGGFDVTKVHMITAWEVLVEMTKAEVAEKFWTIV